MPTEHQEEKQASPPPAIFDQICTAALDNDLATLTRIKAQENTIDIQRNSRTPAQILAGMGEEKAVDCLMALDADKKAIAAAYALNGYPQAKAMHRQYDLDQNEIAELYAQGGHWALAEAMRRNHKASVNAIAAGYARGGHEELAELMRIRHKAQVNYIIHAFIKGGHILPLATIIGRLYGNVDLENNDWKLLSNDQAILCMLTFCQQARRVQLITQLQCNGVIPLTFNISELILLSQGLGNMVAAYPTINFEQAMFHDAINFLLCAHLLPHGISSDLQNIIASYLITTHTVSPKEINQHRGRLVELSRSGYAADFFQSWQSQRDESDIRKAVTLVKQTLPSSIICSIVDTINFFSKSARTRNTIRRACAQTRHSTQNDPFTLITQLNAIPHINEVSELPDLILFITRQLLIAQAQTYVRAADSVEHHAITASA
jgi:hypothetical protein